MKKILITGADGFTGGHLVKILRAGGLDVVPMVQHACGLQGEIVADFCNDDFVQILRGLPEVSAVVHLGAHIGWDGSSRADLFQPNVLATAQLVQWAKSQRAYFVFASAALIAGTNESLITAEKGWELRTDNDYLYSKWLAEQVIQMSGVEYGILRISGIYGKDGPSHLGLNRSINDTISGKPPLLFGDGNIKRNYIYVKDLCLAIKYCLENRLTGIHLAAGTETAVLKPMLSTLCRILLPGREAQREPGSSGYNQVVVSSPKLPKTRSFVEALEDIKKDVEEEIEKKKREKKAQAGSG